MKTVADPTVLAGLVRRLEALHPETARRWGTMSAAEMLCHLGDACDSVLGSEPDRPVRNRPFLKWFALAVPLAWPRGLKTPASVDPQADGTRPGDFEADRRRVIEGLRRLAVAGPSDLQASHGAFGRMDVRDWHRWAYRHTDHHLRQFGL
jgi:hypothetical protein